MEVSMRIFNPLNLNHQLFSRAHQSLIHLPLRSAPLLLPGVRHSRNLPPFVSAVIRANAVSSSSSSFSYFSSSPNSSPLGFLHSSSSLFSQPRNHQPYSFNGLDRLNAWCNDGGLINWYGPQDTVDGDGATALVERGCEVTVVLLGWLGANPKHLRKYAELYTSRRFCVVTFAVSAFNALWFDLGRSVEERISELVDRLVSWLCEESKMDGLERCLVFHTFSNTGWLVYGAILGHLWSRPELIDKIRGCIVDSGAAPELCPQIWAAGFATAMLKKRSHAVHSSAVAGELHSDAVSKLQEKDPSVVEALLLFILERTFSYLLKLPDIDKRLSKIMFILSESQPCCPQLYLYSTADKVIPCQSVESFMEHQRRKGKKVQSFNFVSSPHVDHYRRFPEIYSSKVDSFLDDCLATTLRQN